MIAAYASMLTAVAVVAGVSLVLLWARNRIRPGGHPHRGRIEILGRAGLAPRQGVALVRAGRRVLLVSFGEGGTRALAELSEEDLVAEDVAASEGPGGLVTQRASARPRPELLEWVGATMRRAGLGVVAVLALGFVPTSSAAQEPERVDPVTQDAAADAIYQLLPPVSVAVGDEDGGLRIDGTVGTVLFLGLLAVTPTLLLLTTSFTRILVVLHLLRQALGTQNTPPAHLLAGLALLLSSVVMAPTLEQIRVTAFDPWMAGEIEDGVMMRRAAEPLRAFMLAHAREADLRTFLDISRAAPPEGPEDISNTVLMSAFVTSELRAAFEIGFALFLPFVVIDLVVAAVLTSMGMFMLPPTMIALPCKLLLFVLMDGWTLLMGTLAAGYA